MNYFWPILVAGVVIALRGIDFGHIIPAMLLMTPLREQTLAKWRMNAVVDTSITYGLSPIPEILASDYSHEKLLKASQNYHRPVVVRGLFNDSTAVRMWNDRNYLPDKFGDNYIPVVRDGSIGTLQDDRFVERFDSAFYRLYDSDHTSEYLFFPAKSRFSFPGVDESVGVRLEKRGNEILKEDLDINKIRPGFGDPDDKYFYTGQFVIGKTPEDPNAPRTGSDFHCAGANNWFVQVAGRKRWLFIAPKYSAYLWPQKSGLFNLWTSRDDTDTIINHIPTEYVDLNPGDVLLNPPWQWHKIINYPGFSIGCPLREVSPYATAVNNPFFSTLVLMNSVLSKLGFKDGTGGLPPPSRATEHDN